MELATGTIGAMGIMEVVSRTVTRIPPPTHAGGQDDSSYTNEEAALMRNFGWDLDTESDHLLCLGGCPSKENTYGNHGTPG